MSDSPLERADLPRRASIVLVLAGLLAGCATEDPGIAPPRDRFYFPSAVALDPDPSWSVLYVANANADLKYNGGTLNLVQIKKLPPDLTQVGAEVRAGRLDCHADPFDSTIWECPEEQFIDAGSTVRIGNFPGDMRVSPPAVGQEPRQRRVFVPARGDNYLLWVDAVRLADQRFDLRCTAAQGDCAAGSAVNCETWDCDEAHRVNFSPDRRKQLPAEPFGIELNPIAAVVVGKDGSRRTCLDGGLPAVGCDCGAQRVCAGDSDTDCCAPAAGTAAPPTSNEQRVEDHIFVSHVSGGEVSFFTSGPSGVTLRDIRGGFFTPSASIAGAFSLATQRLGDPRSLTYVSSRVDFNLASFVILEAKRIVDATRAPVGAIQPGNDVRGLAFGPGGDRLFLVNRQPAALEAMDMTPRDQGGLPRQDPVWVAEVCTEPSVVRLGPDPTRPDDKLARLAYVVCFGGGQIFVVETGQGRVVGQIVTGKGPNGLAIDAANRRAFVANFLDNTVGVIDLDPSHGSYNRMVLRIGRNENLLRTED